MKYLKVTFSVFITALVLSTFNVKALVVQIKDVKIPILSGIYMTSQQDKWDTTEQKVKKTKAVDNSSGDGRAISAKVHGMFSGMPSTDWKSIPQNKVVALGSDSARIGGWKLYLRSDKKLLTTATFSGEWTVE